MKPQVKKPEFQFHQEQLERETDADDLESSAEVLIETPGSVGVEIVSLTEQHAEAPKEMRHYRNLNEPS